MARLFGPQEAGVYRAILLYRTGQGQAAAEMLQTLVRAPEMQNASSQDWLGFHLGEALRVAGQPRISEAAEAVEGAMAFDAVFEVFPEVKSGY